MNKKGYVVTYLSFKKYLIFVLIIVGLYLLYYFFILNSLGIISLPKSCPRELIPDRLLLEPHITGGFNPVVSENALQDNCIRNNAGYCTKFLNKWGDGSELKGGSTFELFCQRGSSEGENINYFYCKYLHYENIPMNEDGTIGKKVSLTISLVVDPNNKTDEGYKVVDYKCE